MRKRDNPLVGQFMDLLEEQGYRDTSPRRAVVQAIVQKEKHFTAEALRQQLPGVGRATIYRSLKLFVDAGVLCRVLLEDGSLRYQLSRQGHHHHLLCVHCGGSEDVTGCDIEEQLQKVATSRNFQVSGHWLEIYGRCSQCAETPLTLI